MSRNRNVVFALMAVVALGSGCVSQQAPTPLRYVAVTRPEGPIRTEARDVRIKTSRGGMYVLNKGFRPAPDIGAYLTQAESRAGTPVLRNADVELAVPFALDILLFGFQFGEDTTRVGR